MTPRRRYAHMNRRAFLQTSAALGGPALVTGVTGVTGASPGSGTGRTTGVVWSRRDRLPGTQRMFDVVRGPEHPFTLCGYDTAAGHDRTFLLVADRWGRLRGHRRASDENGLGSRGHELGPPRGVPARGGRRQVAAARRQSGPACPPAWSRTYDGTPEGPVHAATVGDTRAVGWTEPGEPPDTAGTAIVGTDAEGNERWSDRAGDGQRLVELLSTGTDTPSLVAVGTRVDGPGGWTTVWEPDGAQVRTARLETPGDGPAAAVADGGAVTLAGTADEGWWLPRRRPDRGVDWTRTYDADGTDRGVDDLVTLEAGYGLLAHDADGAVVLRGGRAARRAGAAGTRRTPTTTARPVRAVHRRRRPGRSWPRDGPRR